VSRYFSYDGPVLRPTSPPNQPTTGGASISLLGLNFAAADTTTTARITDDMCSTTSWSSDSSVLCAAAASLDRATIRERVHVTVSASVGTSDPAVFSFDAPVLSGIAQQNIAVSGSLGALVTISGLDFVGTDRTPSTYIGSRTLALTTAWTSSTSVSAAPVAGFGTGQPLTISVNNVVSTWLSAFSFDAPAVSFSGAYNGPSTGASLTVVGANFGTIDLTTTASVGVTACPTQTWTSSSSVVCLSSPGSGATLDVSVRVVGVVGTLQAYLTFDAPVITVLAASNAPTVVYDNNVWTSAVTVAGANFGVSNLGPSARIASTACDTTAWITNSYILCLTPKGVGSSLTTAVTVAGLVGTGRMAGSFTYFSYNSPVICGVAPGNAVATGGSSITLAGLQFGPFDATATALLERTSCATISWVSNSRITCGSSLGGGTGRDRHVVTTVAGLVGTATRVFTYDAPVVSGVIIPNGPHSGAAVITLTGLDFGVPAVTASAATNAISQCLTTSWTTVSSVTCTSSPGIGRALQVGITVHAQVGTLLGAFSYDSPVVSFSSTNNALSGGFITFTGLDFGLVDPTASTVLGRSSCGTTVWTSSTAVNCQAPVSPGSSANTLAVVIQAVVGTLTAWHTFDAPIVTVVAAVNAPASAGSSLLLTGLNFGYSDATASARLAQLPCSTTAWSSASVLSCVPPTSVGGSLQVSLTVAGIVGTRASSVSFDAPVVTSFRPSNIATTGSTLTTLSGLNFGASDSTVSAQLSTVATTSCLTLAWSTATTLSCTASAGFGALAMAQVTVSAAVGTVLRGFTYDSPVLTSTFALNAPLTGGPGGAFITLSGMNFGFQDGSVSLRIGVSGCLTSSWYTATQVVCNSPEGRGLGHRGVVTLSALVGCKRDLFSFDPPVFTAVTPQNVAQSGSPLQSLTIFGFNFGGTTNPTPSVQIGATLCQSAVWISDTQLKCRVLVAQGQALNLVGFVEKNIGTSSTLFSFDSPVVTSYGRNSPSTGGISLTISGLDFSTIDFTSSASIGQSLCATASWASSTSVSCYAPQGYGSALAITLTVANTVGTQASVFTYDSPVMTSVGTRNGPAKSGASLSIVGFNFGSSDATMSVSIGQRATVAVWVSQTSVLGFSASGTGAAVAAALSIASVAAATLTGAFTYDSPVLTVVAKPNSPLSGSAIVTVQGLNFGAADPSPTVGFVGSTLCVSSLWTSDTSALCGVPAGYFSGFKLTATVSAIVGTSMPLFSYDSPAVTAVLTPNLPATAAASITLLGLNFVPIDRTPSVSVGGTGCATTAWTTDSAVACLQTSPLMGVSRTVLMSTVDSAATALAAFSYDAPVLTSALASLVAPLVGGDSVTVLGTNFGAADMSATGIIGRSACSTTSWTSSSAMVCVTSPGAGQALSVVVFQAGQSGTLRRAYTYGAPQITTVVRSNGAASAGMSLTLTGANFGTFDATATARIGLTICASTAWTTLTSVLCASPTGVGRQLYATLSISEQVGTAGTRFSYDAPVGTRSQRPNMPTTGAATLSVVGTNFGMADFTATVSVGFTSCVTVSWSSGTAATCSAPAGARTALSVSLTVASSAQTFISAVSFDAPAITSLRQPNAPLEGAATVTVWGMNFGPVDLSATVAMGATACATGVFVSDTSVQCRAPVGFGSSHSAKIFSASSVSTTTGLFTFDGPVITWFTPSNLPTYGDVAFWPTVSGMNFGASDRSVYSITYGFITCESASWVSQTSLSCVTQRVQHGNPVRNLGAALSVNVGLYGQTSTLFRSFTFDAPVMTAASVPTHRQLVALLSPFMEGTSGPCTRAPSSRLCPPACMLHSKGHRRRLCL